MQKKLTWKIEYNYIKDLYLTFYQKNKGFKSTITVFKFLIKNIIVKDLLFLFPV